MTRTLAFLFVCVSTGLAASPLRYSTGEVLQALLDAQDNRAWTRAEVIKTEQSINAKGKPTASQGRLTASGGQARLDLETPSKGLVVADGKFLWVELPQVEQVYRYDQGQLAASGNFFLDLASSIRHYAKVSLKRRIPVGPGFDDGRVVALELIPARHHAMGFERLQVWVETRRWEVLRVLMDYGGNRTDIRFKGVQIMSRRGLKTDPTRALPKDTFKYKRPKGFEVFKIDL